MITDKECEVVRRFLENSSNPIFLFDDDPDGVCSFTLLYRFIEKGRGIVVKNSPEVTKAIYADKVTRYEPDLIVILDKPKVEAEFLNSFSCPIVWIDHHAPQNPSQKNVHYFNPLNNCKESTPTTLQCWRVVLGKQQEMLFEKKVNDLWLAITGCIGDWYYPEDLVVDFQEQYPGLLPKDAKTAPDGLFRKDSFIGILTKVIYFNLKGKTKDTEKGFKILTRIESPLEILRQTTARGKYLYKAFQKINVEYEHLLEAALSMRDDSLFLIAIMPQQKYSFSSELSNEVFYNNSDKVIVVGRSSSDYTKGSLRTSFDISLPDAIDVAVSGLDGYGGGHQKACGFKVNDNDFEIFLDRLKDNISLQVNNLK